MKITFKPFHHASIYKKVLVIKFKANNNDILIAMKHKTVIKVYSTRYLIDILKW